jgi:predicted PurR-regulated permease PerM
MNQASVSTEIKLIRTCAFMIIATLAVYWLIVLRTFLVPMLISILLSILVLPITIELQGKGLRKVPAIIFTLILFLGLIAGILYVSFSQISDMIEMWPTFQQKSHQMVLDLKGWMSTTLGFTDQNQMSELENMPSNLIKSNGSTALLKTTSILADLALIPLYMFFMLYYRHFFCNFLYIVLGKKEKVRVNQVLLRIYDVVHNYLVGLFTVMVIVGALNTIGLLALGIKYAVFFGFFASLLLLIPYIGVIIGSLLPIMMALVTKESPMYAVGVGAIFLFIQFIEGNFITPYIVGSKISINPLMAIIALLLGGMLWGIAGMVLALPMIAILKVILDQSERLKAFGYVLGEPDESVTLPQMKREIDGIGTDKKQKGAELEDSSAVGAAKDFQKNMAGPTSVSAEI